MIVFLFIIKNNVYFSFLEFSFYEEEDEDESRILKEDGIDELLFFLGFYCDFISAVKREYLTITTDLFYIPVWSRVNPGEDVLFEEMYSRF